MSDLADLPKIIARPAQSVAHVRRKPIDLEALVRGTAIAAEEFDVVLGERAFAGPKEYQSDYTKAEIIAARAALSRDGINTEIKTHMGPAKSLLLLVVHPPKRELEGAVVK